MTAASYSSQHRPSGIRHAIRTHACMHARQHTLVSAVYSPMPVTFGSVGDYIAVSQLLNSVRKILWEARGGPNGLPGEIAIIIGELDQLNGVLVEVGRVTSGQRKLEGGATMVLDKDTKNGVVYALGRCYELLRKLKLKLEGARSRFTRAGVHKAFADYFSRCGWLVIGGKKDVEELREKLRQYVRMIQVLLGIPTMCVSHRTYVRGESYDRRTGIVALQKEREDQRKTIDNVVERLRNLNDGYSSEAPFLFFDDDGKDRPAVASLPLRVCTVRRRSPADIVAQAFMRYIGTPADDEEVALFDKWAEPGEKVLTLLSYVAVISRERPSNGARIRPYYEVADPAPNARGQLVEKETMGGRILWTNKFAHIHRCASRRVVSLIC